MLMTTKNGKAIVRVIAIAICALMLVAFGASCSDDTAARAEEAYQAALKAEEAAKEADKAAKDAQDSADEALKEAENAEDVAKGRLTEEAVVELLEKYVDLTKLEEHLGKYVDKDELAAKLADLITEEAIKSLYTADIETAKSAVITKVEEMLADYCKDCACAECKALLEDLEELQTELATEVEKLADAMDKNDSVNAAALEALLEIIETKRAKLAEVKASVVYGDAAVAAINDIFEVVQVKILCATDLDDITAAEEDFAEVLADLPNIVDELYARIGALEGNVIIAVPGYYADSSVDEITALEAIVNIVNNIPELKAEMEDYEVEDANEEANLATRVTALRAEYTALGNALTAAGTVNDAINLLANYNNLKYNDVVNTLVPNVAAANTAVNTWITNNFGTDTDNVNINRILYNRVKYLKNDEGIEADFANVESAAEYAEYVSDLPAKYTGAINALVGTIQGTDPAPFTKWDNGNGYVLAGDLETITVLKTKAEGENVTFEFAGEATYAAAKTVLDNAWNYAAYADYLKTVYNADDSAVKAAVEALVALNGKLTITDVNATENNKFTAYETAYAAWIVLDPATDATFTEVALKAETVTDIVGADNEAAIAAVYARKAVLEAAEDAAEKINLGGTYTYYVKATEYVAGTKYYTSNGAGYVETPVADATAFEAGEYYVATEINGGDGIDQYFDIAEGVWTLKTTLTYRDIVELRRLADVIDLWATTFAIELDVADNYGMVENEKLAEATAKAKELVDAIISAESTKALSKAVANLNKVTSDGKDYSTLYSYLAVKAALEAYEEWDAEMAGAGYTIDTTGIKEFKDAGLDDIYGNLAIAESRAKVTYDAAVADYTAAFYTNFDANFTVETYAPTIYDKFVRDAWAEAEEWVETYLIDESFTDADKLFNVDELELLTADVYAKVKGASEKYEAFITARIGELTALNNRVNAFKNGDAYVINIITDKAAIDTIASDYADWAEDYIDAQADADKIAAADARVTYTATATAVKALDDKYDELYNAAWTAWGTDVAAKIEALEDAEADLYSKVDPADVLKQARDAYDAWATAHIGGAKTSAAFDNMPENDDKLAAYNTAIEAIEALEADVDELAEEYEDVRDTLIADINTKIPATVTSDNAADVAALRERYNAWAEKLVEALETPALYNTAEMKTALEKLAAAETKLGTIKTKLEAVENALADLPAAPNTYVGAADYADKADAYVDAVEALEALVVAYLNENSMTAVVAGDDTVYELDADQAKAIKSASALADSVDAIAEAHALYLEYQAELATTDYTPEEKADRDAALLTTRDTLVNNIVNDATTGEYVATTAAKVERIGRIRMAAILSASGTTAEPELDDTWEDLENWGPTTNP